MGDVGGRRVEDDDEFVGLELDPIGDVVWVGVGPERAFVPFGACSGEGSFLEAFSFFAPRHGLVGAEFWFDCALAGGAEACPGAGIDWVGGRVGAERDDDVVVFLAVLAAEASPGGECFLVYFHPHVQHMDLEDWA